MRDNVSWVAMEESEVQLEVVVCVSCGSSVSWHANNAKALSTSKLTIDHQSILYAVTNRYVGSGQILRWTLSCSVFARRAATIRTASEIPAESSCNALTCFMLLVPHIRSSASCSANRIQRDLETSCSRQRAVQYFSY